MQYDRALYHEMRGRVRHAKIDASSAGVTELVPGQAGKQIVVLRYVLAAAGAVTVNFTDGVNNLTGPFALPAAGRGLDPGNDILGHFAAAPGEALSINLSDDVQVGGHMIYVLAGGVQ